LDEAQELSKGGRGATLKLLEKPRKGVYFILCTMDKDAFPVAVKRRGQYYKFKNCTNEEISDYLISIIQKENLFESINQDFLTDGIFTIAENSLGSPGVAISYLERCIYANIYTNEEIIKELGLLSNSNVYNILEKILKLDIKVFEELKNIDIKEFYLKSFKTLRESYIYKISGYIDAEWKLQTAKILSSYETLKELLERFNKVKNNSYLDENSFYWEILDFFDKNKNVTIPIPKRR
jgi:DNA polymerase III gamma/tau subunit